MLYIYIYVKIYINKYIYVCMYGIYFIWQLLNANY